MKAIEYIPTSKGVIRRVIERPFVMVSVNVGNSPIKEMRALPYREVPGTRKRCLRKELPDVFRRKL
jgi:hypothetical protein